MIQTTNYIIEIEESSTNSVLRGVAILNWTLLIVNCMECGYFGFISHLEREVI